jgi:hypothetical protein
MKDGVTIISLDTESTSEKGELVAFAWTGYSFDATGFRGLSPQDYDNELCVPRLFGNGLKSGTSGRPLCEAIVDSEDREIQGIFHPLCEHSCDTATQQCQHDRKIGSEHTGLVVCKPQKQTFLLLPDTKRCLDDFALLGCHLSNQ